MTLSDKREENPAGCGGENSQYCGVRKHEVLLHLKLKIEGAAGQADCEGLSMMYGEHFSVLNTYWKPPQPKYAICYIISFKIQPRDKVVVIMLVSLITECWFVRQREWVTVAWCHGGEVTLYRPLFRQ